MNESRSLSMPEERIELLSVDLLDQFRDLVGSFRSLAKRLKIDLGWHYLLDFVWIASHLRVIENKRIMDAGAGTGVMQWWLAEQGCNVVSVDRTSRADLSFRFRLAFRVKGLKDGHLKPSGKILRDRLFDKSDHLLNRLVGAGRAAAAIAIGGLTPRAKGEVLIFNMDLARLTELPDASFDYIVSVSSLEHNPLNVLQVIMEELMRVLKPGGYLLATLGASSEEDWFHEPSRGWCFTEATLRQSFDLPTNTPSNFNLYHKLFKSLRDCDELRDSLSPFYFRSGDNGMPWGVWDPKYMPVGVMKVKH
jgi:SAM-dependent methyltransferase